MVTLILFSILTVLCISLLIFIIGSSEDPKTNFVVFIVTCLCIGSLSSVIIYRFNIRTPSALDVYRNKTELKINGYYSNSKFIPSDSIVVFKK